jgi:hypothetical protein
MVSQSAIIPIAVLSALVFVMLVFVVWWFPRTWAKGNAQERAIIDSQAAHLATLRSSAAGVNRPGAEGDAESGEAGPPEEGDDAKPPAYVNVGPPKGYRPPVAGLG